MGDRTNYELRLSDAFAEMALLAIEAAGETIDYEPEDQDGVTRFGFEHRSHNRDVTNALEDRLIPYDQYEAGYDDYPTEVTACRYRIGEDGKPEPYKKVWCLGNDGPTLNELEALVSDDGDGPAITRVLAYIDQARAGMTPEPPIALTKPDEHHEALLGQLRNASLIAAARRERTGETTKTLIGHRLILDQRLYGDVGDEIGDADDAVRPHYLRVTDDHTRVSVLLDGPQDDRVLEASVRIFGTEPELVLDRDDWPSALILRLREGWLLIDREGPENRDLGVPPRPVAHLQLPS